MILRRVIEHFRKQEWTAIAIDFLIVVVGVFVGLQVNNWNELRVDRLRADNYMARGYKENKARFSDIWKVWLPEIPRRPTLD